MNKDRASLIIAAIVGVFAIMYYVRQSRANAAAQNNAGSGSYPYFLTGALPGGATSGGGVSGTSPDNSAGLLSSISQLLQEQLANQNTANAADSATQNQNIMASLISSLTAPQSGSAAIQQGYIAPIAGGGFNFGVTNVDHGEGVYGGYLNENIGGQQILVAQNGNLLNPATGTVTNATGNGNVIQLPVYAGTGGPNNPTAPVDYTPVLKPAA